MSSKNYDYVCIYNPDGKVLPLSNIQKCIDQGALSICLINSNNEGVVIAHKQAGNLEFPQRKVFKINDNTLYTFSGLTNDGLAIRDYIIQKSISERIVKERKIDIYRVLDDLSYNAGFRTICYSDRPYGCGFLLLNFSDRENKDIQVFENSYIQLIEFGVGGKLQIVKAASIGNRSQSARTILERDYVDTLSLDGMVQLGIKSMKNAIDKLESDHVEIWTMNKDGVTSIDPKVYFNV